MSRKNRRKRHTQQSQPDSKIFFSLLTVRLLKDALHFFEAFLRCEPDKTPNLPFAKEVVAGLKAKLNEMLEREEWHEETPLDYNEIHLLHTSCAMYLIELKFTHQYTLIPPCIQLCKQLALVVEHVDKEVRSQH
ncbi:hypothetical protein EPA93_03995 [Ktedonosporobacter rubrisoli]|uniref:Uncharacterized protein n=1 Tax=Ktedonosporobacter rubrisoli TaxID=2509675 RepID=A0A4P6JJC8_KTERU|nr:hypothetical protein [Ktedonosporobacter rubrisoli]QBD75199.1 hypothetical protein EPA93_03995 [Ktedonosporobacter rubrisoli]